MIEIRVTTYRNDNGTYFAVQGGKTVRGRWKTATLPVRAEKLFCIEERMTSNERGEYEKARERTKVEAEQYAEAWRKRSDITAAMALPPTPHINKDWEDDPNLHELQERIEALKNADGEQATLNNFDARTDFDRDYTQFHARRIATLVKAIRQGKGIQPVSLDITYGLPFQRYSGGHGCSYIDNGHHRIAALQYEGFKVFPAYAQGVTSEIKKVQLVKRNPVCKTCGRNTQAPLFDGCMTPNCPRGFTPCY
jgi:hypothetical protein